jgi:hypothetical protein
MPRLIVGSFCNEVKLVFLTVLSRSPVVKIAPARTVTGEEEVAPKVAAFSSRGPSINYPAEVIKVPRHTKMKKKNKSKSKHHRSVGLICSISYDYNSSNKF